MEGWKEFFLGEVGASAALAGLVFVAISINLDRILAIPGMAERGGQAMLLLLAIVVVSSFGLSPAKLTTFGFEVIGTAAAFLAFSWFLESRSFGLAERSHRRFRRFNTALQQVALVPYLIGGILMASTSNGGRSGCWPASSSASSRRSAMPGCCWSRSSASCRFQEGCSV